MQMNDDEMLYEKQFTDELVRIANQAKDGNLFIRYLAPTCVLAATAFHLRVDGKTVQILLQRDP